MYISPTSEILLYGGVPLYNNYLHTYKVPDLGIQETAFKKYLKFTLTKYTYVREQQNTIYVELSAHQVANCNYLSFTNNGQFGETGSAEIFNEKRYFCFITNFEYVNNTTTKITYEIDYLQTYMLDIEWLPSYIVREHTNSDEIGEYTLDEGFNFNNEYVAYETNLNLTEKGFSIVALVQKDNVPTSGSNFTKYDTYTIHGVPTNVAVLYYNDMNDFIQAFDVLLSKGYSQYCVAIYCIPKGLGLTSSGYIDMSSESKKFFPTTNLVLNDNGTKTDVKNNKCLTAPYNCIEVEMPSGTTINFNLALVDTLTVDNLKSNGLEFYIEGCVYPTPTIRLYPTFTYNKTVANRSNGIAEECAVDLPFAPDNFGQWAERNLSAKTISALTKALSASLAGATIASPLGLGSGLGALVGGLGSLGSTALNTISEGIQATHTMPPLHGDFNANMLDIMTQNVNILIRQKCCNPDVMSAIDNYFTMYGYKINRVKKPNFLASLRPFYCYVQTKGANFIGNIPNEAHDKICEIHDRGLTYWKDLQYVGNYEVSNNL